MSERNEMSIIKILFVISLIFYLGTIFFLGSTIIGLRETIEAQNSRITDLNNQISQMRSEISILRETIQNGIPPLNVSYSQIYDMIKDSVVVVQAKIVEQTIFGEINITVQGSGFIYNYSGELIIITNNHVVNGATETIISFLDGDAYTASLIGSDSYSDVAVLSTKAPRSKLKPIVIVSSSSLKIGQPVIAVGNPFGLAGSMTTGVISQLGRTISESTTGYAIADVIQTSAPINPGNSGGPLLNERGEVIGVTTAIVQNSQGLGFAIPSDTILRELPYIIEGESYPHPWLGMKGVDVNFDIAKAMNLNLTYGWLIVEVLPNSPAEKADLRAGTQVVFIDGSNVRIGGDVITLINGTRIRNGDDLFTYLERNTKPGHDIQITVIRSGQMVNITVTLGVRPTAS